MTALLRQRGFSLIEVLLAVFILGIGVISIAALFPAGIAQQRLSVDDVIGPTVANNAIDLIRRKVRVTDFGSMEDLGIDPFPMQTIPYDWPWGRPEYFFINTTITTANFGTIDVTPGSISIFAHPLVGTDPSTIEIPWSLSLGGPTTPPADPIIITQRERYYPMAADVVGQDAPRPQFVWDCMFRRFQGKILVAIFVYRVNEPGQGTPKSYSVPPNATNPQVPPVPVWLPFIDAVTGAQINNTVCALGAWDVGGLDGDITTAFNNALVAGTENGTVYDSADQRQAWQEPRQWILDQNNNVHRVLGQSRENYNNSTGNVEVELVRPISFMPLLPVHFLPHPTNASYSDVVNNIWYMPLEMQADSNLNGTIDPGEPALNLTPIYMTVREL